MSDHLLVAILGNRNSGKSTTWNTLFDKSVRTGKSERRLHLNCAQSVDVFLVNGSPEEKKKEVSSLLPKTLPQIVLCSTQYREGVTDTFEYFFKNDYEVFVQWLNPGYKDSEEYSDQLSLKDYLLNKGATLQVRDGKINPPVSRVKDIHQYILGWATYRDLIYTEFP